MRPASRRVTARKYPQEWRWWRASGWDMMVQDADNGGLWLHTRRNGTLWGDDATAEQAATAEGVRRFLLMTLYLHLHPIKAGRSYAATGSYCTDTELAAFIRQQRRKEKKGSRPGVE